MHYKKNTPLASHDYVRDCGILDCGMNVVPILEYGVLLLQAFVKRMLYVCACHSPSFVCGSLVLLSELLKEKPALWPFVMQSNDAEEFGDAPANRRGVERRDGEGEEGVSGAEEEKTEKTVGQSERYRIGHRNPQFSGAETTCLWELREVCITFLTVEREFRWIYAYLEIHTIIIEDVTRQTHAYIIMLLTFMCLGLTAVSSSTVVSSLPPISTTLLKEDCRSEKPPLTPNHQSPLSLLIPFSFLPSLPLPCREKL
jgi:hypothetical protein